MTLCCLCKGRRLISNVPDSKKFQHGVTSVKGFKPGINDWVNQDNFFVHEDTTDLKGGRHIYAVFDGHGRYGHDVSAFCSDELQGILEISEKYSNIIQGLQDALETSSIDIEASGTTATIIILQEDYVEVSHLFHFERINKCLTFNNIHNLIPQTLNTI